MKRRAKLIHNAKKVCRERSRALSDMRTAAETNGLSVDEDLACILPGQTVKRFPKVCEDANSGFPEDEVREIGKYANRLGLDGVEISKWFLPYRDLHEPKVLKRLRDAIKKHYRDNLPHRNALGIKVTVNIGENTFTHYLTEHESITIKLG